MAAQGLGRHEEALEYFLRAARLAEPDGILLSIAEYGAPLASIVNEALERNPGNMFLARLVGLNKHYASLDPGDPWKLTRRERELLERVAEGIKNEDIASLLGVKPVAVGNTLTRVYRKIGAQNRTVAAKYWRAQQRR